MRLAAPGTAPDVEQMRRTGEAGFTLVEIVVVVAIVVTTALAGVAISLGSRSFAVATAASEFDHMIDSARTIARETQGATLLFAPDAFGDGTEVRVVTPGPNGTLSPTAMPVFHTRAAIEESESLGKPPFAFVLHATGALGGRPGYRTGNPNAIPEVGCPARGAFHFLIHTAGAAAERTLPCKITLAATGPLAIAPWPAASVAPLPTPCSNCAPDALPTPPSFSPTCPPNYSSATNGCAPSVTGLAPNYHVTATVTSASMGIASANFITAQATLTNSSITNMSAPSSVGVLAKPLNASICSIGAADVQQAGYIFPVNAVESGQCDVLLTADLSLVPMATSDSMNLTITIIPSAPPTQPPPCDISVNAKCYHRIIDETTQAFTKTVYPNVDCSDNTAGCIYVDSIAMIQLAFSYGFRPPVAPTDPAHELLFRILRITGATYECEAYLSFQGVPAPDPILWSGATVGGPIDSPLGFGEPDEYITINHVYTGPSASGVWTETDTAWPPGTTLSGLFDAVGMHKIGVPYSFTYSSPDTASSDYVLWSPDFPGCDSSGDSGQPPARYGVGGVNITFEIYQANE